MRKEQIENALGSVTVDAKELTYYGGQDFAEADVTLPRDVAGTQYIIVTADGSQTVAESNETNNSSHFELTIRARQPDPDLQPTNLSLAAGAAANTSAVTTYTIENKEPGSTRRGFTDRIYYSADAQLNDTDPVLTAVSQGELEAGKSSIVNRTIGLPYIPGPGFLFVKSDVVEQQVETNETNNLFSVPVTIVAAPPTDLQLVALAIGGTPVPGGTADVVWAVRNTAATATPPFGRTDRVYFSADATLDGSDTLLGESVLSGDILHGWGTIEPQPQRDVSPATRHGFVIVVTGATNTQPETNETNNQRVIPVSLERPDLRPTRLSLAAPPTY